MASSIDSDDCGCCAGIDAETPVLLTNRPAQTALSYRIGTHGRFKESMFAALTSAERPALLPLGTRDDDDLTIAYLDGVATILDVLTFYQERYVNENYLATATERRSVLELAQLIGYELSPGVAASTHLAFKLQESPGVASGSETAITIPAGTRVQSVPAQDEDPQIFETTSDISARASWNAVSAQTTLAYAPEHGDLDVYVDGLDSNVVPGDAVLIVGQHRTDNPGSERWDVRVVKSVESDRDNQRTRLVWDVPLGHTGPTIQPSDTDVRLYVFRTRVGLFGHNAPDPRLMNLEDNNVDSLVSESVVNLSRKSLSIEEDLIDISVDNRLNPLVEGSGANLWWKDYEIQDGLIDLAVTEDKVIAGSWIALVSNDGDMGTADLPGYLELYRAKTVSTISRTDYGLSAKITRIEPDTTENIDEFGLQKTLALVASEELPIHRRPIHHPLYGDLVALEGHVEGLATDQYLSVSGMRQRLRVAPGVNDLLLQTEANPVALSESDSLLLLSAPESLSGTSAAQLTPEEFGALIDGEDSATQLSLHLLDRDGIAGTVICNASDWRWGSAWETDETVAEIGRVDEIGSSRDRSSVTLTASLDNVYQRDTVSINFNVAPATHGETIAEEILGDGDAREPDQTFVLKQMPLTYVSADSPSGAAATLEVRVNDLRWSELPSLYRAGAGERVYKIRHQDDGGSVVIFGDGVEGGRLPTGTTNVRASYRKFVGSAANLNAGSLATLLQKPLGVSEVTNPEPSGGGADREQLKDARQNAPLTVLTLDRAVSVLDYQHYARAFAGVAKAHALWIDSGPSRGIYISLAGTDGADIPDDSDTYTNLEKSLRRYGDPLLPLTLVNHVPASFILGLAVKVQEDADSDKVMEELESTLREYFSFENRDFGQHVSRDEVYAVAHAVEYVEAIRLTRFYKDEPGAVDSVAKIIASHLPVASLTDPPSPAEILTLSDETIEMGTFA
jgi:hypothetical protein